jgi:glycosyltransferase involved in cell wall biosynthesis
MKSPVFSIITITRNADNVLEQTILSVLNQTYNHIEYIVIDGASTDNSVNLIMHYKSGISYWISEHDSGLYDAMNKGLRAATGDYVWFLNAGDVLKHNEIVAELAEIASRNELPDILYGETDLMDRNGHVLAERRLKAPHNLTWKSFRMGMLVCHQAFIAKRSMAPKYNLKYRFSADFDWCIRCLKESNTVVHTQLRLVNYLYEGLTTGNRKKSLKERYRIMCKYYGIFATTLFHGWFAVRFSWAKLTKKVI